MKEATTKCLICGSELEASLKIYLSHVEVSADGQVSGSLAASLHGGPRSIQELIDNTLADANEEELELYCAESHDLEVNYNGEAGRVVAKNG
jgi:hypothetical protein